VLLSPSQQCQELKGLKEHADSSNTETTQYMYIVILSTDAQISVDFIHSTEESRHITTHLTNSSRRASSRSCSALSSSSQARLMSLIMRPSFGMYGFWLLARIWLWMEKSRISRLPFSTNLFMHSHNSLTITQWICQIIIQFSTACNHCCQNL